MTPALALALLLPCATLDHEPLQVVAAEGGQGLIHRVEPRSELELSLQPRALIDAPNLYGMLLGSLVLEGSWAASSRLELFGRLPVLQYRVLQNGPLREGQFSLGELALGISVELPATETFESALFLRLYLPTSTEYRQAWPLGLEPGFSARGWISEGLLWHAGLAAPITSVLSRAGAPSWFEVCPLFGGEWMPRQWLALVLDAQARLGTKGGFEQFSLAIGMRAIDGGSAEMELAAVFPLVGAWRFGPAGMLGVRWLFDGADARQTPAR